MVVVAAPAAILAAIFALLFMVCWAQWGTTITRTMNINLPIIGNVIGNAISGILTDAYQYIVYLFDNLIYPVAQLIVSPVAAVENIVGGLILSTEQAYNAIYSVVATRIPLALGQAVAWANQVGATNAAAALSYFQQGVGYANQVGAAATATATADLGTAIGYANQIGAEVTATATADLGTAIGYANQIGNTAIGAATTLYNQAIGFTQDAYSAATGYATGLATKAENDIAAALHQAEGYAETTATAAVAAGVTDIDNAITGALSGIWTDVDGAITDVIGVIGTGDAAIRDALGRIDWSIPANLAAVASLAGVTSLTLARYLRDCGIPNCQNLSQLGKDLQGILAIANDASFLTLILELIHDPGDAAATVDNAFGDVIGAGIAQVRSLIGV